MAPRPNRMETLEKLRIARPLDARRAGLWAARAAVAAAFLVAMNLDVRGERPPPRDRQPLPTFAGRSGRSHVDPRLSGVARALTARSVEVRCWSARDWRRRSGEFYANLRTARNRTVPDGSRLYGFVSGDRARVSLPTTSCNALETLRYVQAWPAASRPSIAVQLAQPTFVFSHELEHVRGTKSEVRADCFGLQSVREVAVALGAPAAQAGVMARYAASHLYPTNRPEASAECRNGGRLDLRPGSPQWP